VSISPSTSYSPPSGSTDRQTTHSQTHSQIQRQQNDLNTKIFHRLVFVEDIKGILGGCLLSRCL
jgi:hypothetical protein